LRRETPGAPVLPGHITFSKVGQSDFKQTSRNPWKPSWAGKSRSGEWSVVQSAHRGIHRNVALRGMYVDRSIGIRSIPRASGSYGGTGLGARSVLGRWWPLKTPRALSLTRVGRNDRNGSSRVLAGTKADRAVTKRHTSRVLLEPRTDGRRQAARRWLSCVGFEKVSPGGLVVHSPSRQPGRKWCPLDAPKRS